MIDQIIAFNKTFVEQKGYEGVGDCKSPPTVQIPSRQEVGGAVMYGHEADGTAPCGSGSEERRCEDKKDIVVRGFIIDSETGKLEEIW